MVRAWTNHYTPHFSTHLSTFQKLKHYSLVSLLLHLSRVVQYRLGLPSDQPYEPSTIFDLLKEEKGKCMLKKDKLNNYRNSFSFLANFVVLTLGLAVFFFMKNKEEEYKIIAELVLVIGAMTSLFFIWQVREPQLSQICQ